MQQAGVVIAVTTVFPYVLLKISSRFVYPLYL